MKRVNVLILERVPERESSWDTKRTSFDFMKFKAVEDFLSPEFNRVDGDVTVVATVVVVAGVVQGVKEGLRKKTMAVERERRARIINGHVFFFCGIVIHALDCFAILLCGN